MSYALLLLGRSRHCTLGGICYYLVYKILVLYLNEHGWQHLAIAVFAACFMLAFKVDKFRNLVEFENKLVSQGFGAETVVHLFPGRARLPGASGWTWERKVAVFALVL